MTIAVQLGYMAAATLLVLGLRFMGSPASALKGNRWLAMGMALALLTTLVSLRHFSHLVGVLVAVAAGVLGGTAGARRVKMTAMPQMVAMFNGLGGGAAALVAAGGWHGSHGASLWLALVTVLLGSVSFGGSVIAFLKLQEWLPSLKGLRVWRMAGILAMLVAISFGIAGAVNPTGLAPISLTLLAAALAGAMLTLPIGGADMPVVISLLNALTGLSAAATGFVLHLPILIIAGTLVGASGTILTQEMSRAMHRSLLGVLWGTLKGSSGAAEQEGSIQEASAQDIAWLLRYARSVAIVPGYGLAVSRAQMEVKQVTDLLTRFGVQVVFGIHPVAGRMPGHMNVLLAEANIDYEALWEMDRINPRFRDMDVVLVLGANAVTNPAARTAQGSPLYGMPILNVDDAKAVVVLKRSLGRGFAGVDNPLYYDEKTRMLFGDAKATLTQLARELETTA